MGFDRGMGVLTGAMRAGSAPAQAGRRRAASSVTAAAGACSAEDGDAIDADHVVLATPARVAAPLVRRARPGAGGGDARHPHSGVAVVACGFRVDDIPRPLDGYGYLVTRAEVLATLGVLWESSIFPHRAPGGMALLRIFMGGARRPDIVAMDEEALVELARVELRRVLGVVRAPAHVSVFRWPEAIAQYTLGHAERRARIASRLLQHEGLHVCGTSYDGVSFNHAIKSGRAMSRMLADRLWPAATPDLSAAARPGEGDRAKAARVSA